MSVRLLDALHGNEMTFLPLSGVGRMRASFEAPFRGDEAVRLRRDVCCSC